MNKMRGSKRISPKFQSKPIGQSVHQKPEIITNNKLYQSQKVPKKQPESVSAFKHIMLKFICVDLKLTKKKHFNNSLGCKYRLSLEYINVSYDIYLPFLYSYYSEIVLMSMY